MKMKNFPWFHFLVFNPLLPVTVEHLSYLIQSLKIWSREYPVQAVSDLILNDIYPSSVKAESDTNGSWGIGMWGMNKQTKLSIPVKAQSDLRSSDTQYPSNGQLLVRAGNYLPVALKIKDSVLKIR